MSWPTVGAGGVVVVLRKRYAAWAGRFVKVQEEDREHEDDDDGRQVEEGREWREKEEEAG